MGGLLALIAGWNSLLPGIVAAGQNGLAAWQEIKAILAARGIEADTAALDAALPKAIARHQHEQDILSGD